MSIQNQVRALSRIRRALAEAEAEIAESEREYLEAGGNMPVEIEDALRALHARVRLVNGLLTARAKETLEGYDDQKTPARTPSAMMRAADPEAVRAFERSVELMKKKDES
jgi:hypothetical protein